MDKYKEIFRLKEMLEQAKIPFVFREFNDFRNGYQILYPEGNTKTETKNVCSVIEHSFSYGNREDLLEIMGLLTEEESKHDDVVGYLSAEDVFERIKNNYEMINNNVIDLYLNKKFPEEWQDKIDAFANASLGVTDEKYKFGRAMFFIGMHIKAIRKDMGIEE